ncbi:MAG: ISL3 family transposase [Ktedonobacteraceae bacterium]|nr:ISL3 family transposase [Ktedonobacteraceae bacterium]
MAVPLVCEYSMPPLFNLLRLPPHFRVLDVTQSPAGIRIVLASEVPSASCPRCLISSTSRHSTYTRTAQDLAWSGQSVTFQVVTHKWRCRVAQCAQRVFAERLDPLLRRSARMTTRLIDLVCSVTLATSGRSAARLTAHITPALSPTTLVRHIMTLPEPAIFPAHIIGIDEFSFRRGKPGQGHHFGTIIVDLERHRVLDLLPERDVVSVAAWLRNHPTIQVVSRDRSGTFAQAITTALPEAQQVLDRFHLLQNLRDVLERFFLTKRDVLRQMRHPPMPSSPPPSARLPEHQSQDERVARWVQIHQQIHDLVAKQVDVTTIARRLHVSRPTVYRYLHMIQPPSVKHPSVRRTLDPFIPYILQRWNEGVRNAQLIWRELTNQGYTHSVSNVGRFVKQLRQETALPLKFKHVLPASLYDVTIAHAPLAFSAIQVARLVVRHPERRARREQEYLERLRTADDQIEGVCRVAEQFCQMVRLRQGERLDAWVTAAQSTALRSFVMSLLKEENALRAGLTQATSQGQTEGQVHKLKLIKRQGYGHAGFALLRQRVLHANSCSLALGK